MNRSLAQVTRATDTREAMVYCYIIATIENRDGRFVQHGSGPNFQGGVISLCTCKHRMRAFKDSRDWEGVWIAGFTGVAAGRGRNTLVYLMRVAHAFDSHAAIWTSKDIPTETKQAKAAHLHPFGDIFQPKDYSRDPFDPHGYIAPHRRHVHGSHRGWHNDIDYSGRGGRRAALLFGDATASYLWDRPRLALPFRLHQGQKKADLGWLLSQLDAE